MTSYISPFSSLTFVGGLTLSSGLTSPGGGLTLIGDFSPIDIPGLQAWYDATYGVYQDGAAHFTAASSQRLTCADNASFNFGTGSLSVAFWVKTTQVTEGVLISKRNGSGFNIELLGNKLYADGAGTAGVSSTGSINDGGWHLCTVVYDRVGALLRLYVDGAANNTIALGSTTLTDAAPLSLGAYPSNSIFFEGSLDSVGIWTRVLSPAEITGLYNSGAGVTFSGLTSGYLTNLVSWWDLNEESGTRFDAYGTNDLTASTLAIISGATLNGNFETAGTNGGTITGVPTSTVARAANIATIVTGIAHGLSSTNVVTITGVTDTTFNAVGVVVTVVNATTFTYPNAGSVVVTASDTGGRIATDVFASWTEATAGSSTANNDSSAPLAGAHSLRLDIDSSNSAASAAQTVLVVSNLYSYSILAKADSGTPSFYIGSTANRNSHTLSTSAVTYSGSFVADATTFKILNNAATSKSLFFDTAALTDLGPVGIAGIAIGLAINGDLVSKWLDRSINTRNLLQVTESKRPTYRTNIQNGKPALLFDGVDDYLQALYTLAQPVTVFMAVKQLTWVNGSYIVDGGTLSATALQQHTTSGHVTQNAGSYGGDVNLGTASFGILTAIFNGASSQLQLNNGTPSTGDAGTSTTAGITVGAGGNASGFSNIYVCEIIEYNSVLTAAQITQVNNYMNQKWAIY